MLSLQVKKRIVDQKLMKDMRELPCYVCGAPGPNDVHHIKSKGAGGDDTEQNLVTLCHKHHQELHQVGQLTFADRNQCFKNLLYLRGFIESP